jgi:hypothetical protein
MEEILQRLLNENFSELRGLTVDASIPFPEQLVNEFVGSALQGNKTVTELYIAIHSANKIAVNLKTSPWPLPIQIKLRLEPSVDFANGPRVRASLENFALLGKLGAIFKAFPPGITLEDDQIIVDIGSFLKDPQQRKWLELIQSMQIHTEEARITFDVKVAVA